MSHRRNVTKIEKNYKHRTDSENSNEIKKDIRQGRKKFLYTAHSLIINQSSKSFPNVGKKS